MLNHIVLNHKLNTIWLSTTEKKPVVSYLIEQGGWKTCFWTLAEGHFFISQFSFTVVLFPSHNRLLETLPRHSTALVSLKDQVSLRPFHIWKLANKQKSYFSSVFMILWFFPQPPYSMTHHEGPCCQEWGQNCMTHPSHSATCCNSIQVHKTCWDVIKWYILLFH